MGCVVRLEDFSLELGERGRQDHRRYDGVYSDHGLARPSGVEKTKDREAVWNVGGFLEERTVKLRQEG